MLLAEVQISVVNAWDDDWTRASLIVSCFCVVRNNQIVSQGLAGGKNVSWVQFVHKGTECITFNNPQIIDLHFFSGPMSQYRNKVNSIYSQPFCMNRASKRDTGIFSKQGTGKELPVLLVGR